MADGGVWGRWGIAGHLGSLAVTSHPDRALPKLSFGLTLPEKNHLVCTGQVMLVVEMPYQKPSKCKCG